MLNQPESYRLLNSLKTPVILIASHSKIIWVNAATEELLQMSQRQLCQHLIEDLFEKQNLIQSGLASALDNHNTVTIREIALTTTQQRHIVTCSINPISSCSQSQHEHAIASIEITPENHFSVIKNTQQPTQSSHQNLIQGVAHEIKNPLGGILGAAQLLAPNLSQRENKEMLNIIVHETKRLNNLVDRMLGHIEGNTELPINIHRILEHIIKLITADPAHTAQIKRDYDPSLPNIHGSETALTQALLNLVLNAAQATKGTSATIVLRSRLISGMIIANQQHRQTIRIDIQDNGAGVKPEISEQIFEPLVSSKPQGTGLGLSITEKIISAHQGKIEFSSVPGKTVFSVYLPIKSKTK